MKTPLKILLPLIVLAAGVLIAKLVIDSAEEPPKTPVVSVPPLVTVVGAEPRSVTLDVVSHGTVVPRTESRLVPRVAGRVEWISPAFVVGGFFEQGEPLLRLDSRDYELMLISARSEVARAELELAMEESEAEVAATEWRARETGPADPLVLREPQVAQARAALEASRARVEQAQLDLARTTIEAPFAGRVRSRSADVGRFVQPGAELAVLYAVDRAEIRLPVPDAELAFLDLPLAYRGGPREVGTLPVTIEADFAGGHWSWSGRVERTEGEIDARNRMLHLVAVVEDPYGQDEVPGRPPLAVGLFVKATLHGHRHDDLIVLPREALRGRDRVFVIDDDDRLRFRHVDPLRVERDRVVLRSGLAAGERVCTSLLETALEGMRVRVEAHGDDGVAAR